MTPCDSLAMELPDTLTIDNIFEDLDLASSMAPRVSAVSPDCEMAITRVFSSIVGFLYLNSAAYSTSAGILTNFSIRYSPIRAACQDVPQAVSTTRLNFL